MKRQKAAFLFSLECLSNSRLFDANGMMSSISEKKVRIELLLHSCYDSIGAKLADVINECGGMSGDSKSAQRSKRLGTKEGISAIVSRWLMIQELYGVVLCCSVDG